MYLNYQKARDLMVKNQLRPNKIKDKLILNLFKEMPKEDFLIDGLKVSPYSDLDINISHNRGYLKNLHIAQLINNAEIEKNHKILHLGALTGYVTALLSILCFEVIAVEPSDELRVIFKDNINKHKIKNIKIVKESLKYGYDKEAPFDIIFIDNPIKKIDDSLLIQLNDNLGKIIMIQKDINLLNQAFKITKNKSNFSKEYLFDVFTKYELYEESEGFVF